MPVKLLSVRVGPAAFGSGVFACRHFRRGDRIGRVYGEAILDDGHDSEYAIDLGHGWLLEPGEPFRFLNHNCQPNCELVNYTPDDAHPQEHEVYIRALRRIAAGEELTIDYAWPADAAIPCGCRAPQCRGWIVHADQLPQLLDLQQESITQAL